jgi:hypothetical protein
LFFHFSDDSVLVTVLYASLLDFGFDILCCDVYFSASQLREYFASWFSDNFCKIDKKVQLSIRNVVGD